MLHIVLVEPEIPQNCGNVARTCAATGSQLHLIRPLGFDISEKAVRRAGLDYWNLVEVFDYENLEDFFRRRPEAERDLWLTTTKAPRSYQEARFTADSTIVSMGVTYSAIVFFFAIVNMASLAFEKLFQAVGRMKLTMIALISGCVCNILLDPVLIFGLGLHLRLLKA
mgnify:FL=1